MVAAVAIAPVVPIAGAWFTGSCAGIAGLWRLAVRRDRRRLSGTVPTLPAPAGPILKGDLP